MKRLAAVFLTIPPVWAVAVVFLVPALETALILGVMVPGELTVVLGGALAARGRAPLSAILAAAVLGATAGDIVGYFLGRRYGEAIVRRKLKKKWGRAHRWLSSKGRERRIPRALRSLSAIRAADDRGGDGDSGAPFPPVGSSRGVHLGRGIGPAGLLRGARLRTPSARARSDHGHCRNRHRRRDCGDDLAAQPSPLAPLRGSVPVVFPGCRPRRAAGDPLHFQIEHSGIASRAAMLDARMGNVSSKSMSLKPPSPARSCMFAPGGADGTESALSESEGLVIRLRAGHWRQSRSRRRKRNGKLGDFELGSREGKEFPMRSTCRLLLATILLAAAAGLALAQDATNTPPPAPPLPVATPAAPAPAASSEQNGVAPDATAPLQAPDTSAAVPPPQASVPAAPSASSAITASEKPSSSEKSSSRNAKKISRKTEKASSGESKESPEKAAAAAAAVSSTSPGGPPPSGPSATNETSASTQTDLQPPAPTVDQKTAASPVAEDVHGNEGVRERGMGVGSWVLVGICLLGVIGVIAFVVVGRKGEDERLSIIDHDLSDSHSPMAHTRLS